MQLLDKYHQSETNAHFFCQTKKKKKGWTDCRDVLASKLQNSHEVFFKSYFKELMPLSHHHSPVLRYQQRQVIHFHLLASFKTQLKSHFRGEDQFWAELQQTFSGAWLNVKDVLLFCPRAGNVA